MNIIWGIILTIVAALGWLGQVMTTLWPKTAVTLNLTEPKTDKVMQRRGIRIGTPEAVKVNAVFLALSGLVAIITIVMAVAALPLT